MVESKQYELVLYRTVTGKGVEFGASWMDDVDRVYMPLNLDHHWVLVEMNLKDRTIFVYDSMKTVTHMWQEARNWLPLLTSYRMSSLVCQGM